MNTLRFYAPLSTLVLLLAGVIATAAERPNVILIMTDDQGYGDVGAHGNTMIRTPHLDRLHGESVRFTDFHVDPTCSPTRAALLTGRYSTRTGVWHTVMGRSILFRDEVTLGDVFAANGYRTGIFGKWHLGDNYPSRPQDRGFQQVVIHGGGGIGQTPDFWGNDYQDDHYLVNGAWRPFRGYCTDVFFAEAIRFMEEVREQPFFVYLPANVAHSPFNVPDQYRQRCLDRGVPEPMASFYGMIENFDENLGRLRTWLERTGRDRDTIIVFLTDNGTSAGVPRTPVGDPERVSVAKVATGWNGFDAGMRASKGSPYEGGHRVPLFIRWPKGGVGGGREVSRLAAHFDLLPTLVELCGLKFTPPNPLDGRSLVPLLRGAAETWPDRTLLVHKQREEIPPKWLASAVLTPGWRLLNGIELYEIARDPGQRTDVSRQHPDVVARLRADYEKWWASLTPSFTRIASIIIGHPDENPIRFTCMDWHAQTVEEIPWNQVLIDEMPAVNGWWMLEVATSGRYAFTLRHQPEAARFPLQASRARVKLGGLEATAAVADGATSITLELEIPAGPVRFETTLFNDATSQSRGAFYVEARRVSPWSGSR